MQSERLKLNDGNTIPNIGLGVYKIGEEQMTQAIDTAYRAGYRLFDTATFYKNEDFLGSTLNELGIKRSEIFLTTKAWTGELGRNEIKATLQHSLSQLQTSYVDLYLIHWPIRDAVKLSETWKAMEELKDEGLARSIGVSNFNGNHLDIIERGCRILPAVNQIERHPLLTQENVISRCRKENILVEAWSPLMRGKKVMELETIRLLAEKYQRSPAQIILHWNLRQGIVPIPKSISPERIEENIHVFDFSLTEKELHAIDALNQNVRSGADPDSYQYD